jgi:hypothetical protein
MRTHRDEETTWVKQIDVEEHIKEFITSELHDIVLEFVLELLNLELWYYKHACSTLLLLNWII